MGQKEIILIVLSIIMVIMAILYGVSMFQMHFQAAQRDALISELNYIHLRTYVHWIRSITSIKESRNGASMLNNEEVTANPSLGDWLTFDDFTYSPYPGCFFSTTNGIYTMTTEHIISGDQETTESYIVIYAAGQGYGKDKKYLNNRSWGNSLFTFPDESGRVGKAGLICYKTTFNLKNGEVSIEILN